jgi:hypothetical protein
MMLETDEELRERLTREDIAKVNRDLEEDELISDNLKEKKSAYTQFLEEDTTIHHSEDMKVEFRPQNRVYVLGYTSNTSVDKKDFLKFLDKQTKHKVEACYRYPADGGTLFYINFKESFRTRKRELFDYKINKIKVRPQIRTISSQKNWKRLVNILIKMNKHLEDFEKDESLTDYGDKLEEKEKPKAKRASPKKKAKKDDSDGDKRSDFEKVSSCANLQEALTKYGKFQTAQGIVTMWNNRKIQKPVRTDEERDWYNPDKQLKYRYHQELWDMLSAKEWNYRQLMWIVDPPGGMDKSAFVRCFVDVFEGVVLKTAAGAKDISKLLANKLKNGGKLKYILIDLPRQSAQHKMWDTIECMMDGVFSSLKYDSEELRLIDRPRIIVFSNEDPPFHPSVNYVKSKEAKKDVFIRAPKGSHRKWVTDEGNSCGISDDRWKIFDLVEGKRFYNRINEEGVEVRTLRKSIWLKERENPFFDPDFEKKKPFDPDLRFMRPGQAPSQPAGLGDFVDLEYVPPPKPVEKIKVKFERKKSVSCAECADECAECADD